MPARPAALERLFALETFGIKLGLSKITRLTEILDHPERSFRSVHVAGTNGKGSVTAMVHAALVAAGIRSARYTSPHLVDLAERYVIGRRPVDAASLAAVAELVVDRGEKLVVDGEFDTPATFFEATTAIGFELFRRAHIEIGVIEVGLGGRFDATNVIRPAVTAITSIGLDHQQQLGTTLAAIAFEKAGIIKPKVPVIVGPVADEALGVIEHVASERGAPIIRVRDRLQVDVRLEEGRAVIDVETPAHRYGPIALGLRGDHQIDNALVAIRILEALREQETRLSFEAIARGLSDVEWPARLELIDMGEGQRVLIDSAHNPDGALALARYIQRWHPGHIPLVFGAMHDKDVAGMLRALLPVVGPVIVTAPAMKRALDIETLASIVRDIDPGRDVITDPDPAHAVDRALALGVTACVAGSIFLVGAVRDALIHRDILR